MNNTTPVAPLHQRIWALPQVRYMRVAIATFISMIWLTIIFGLIVLWSFNFSIKPLEQILRGKAVEALEFIFPDYLGEIGTLEFNFNGKSSGLVSIGNIVLFDPLNERSILIEQFRMSPSVFSLFGGRPKFNYIGVDHVEVSYRNSELEGDKRLIFPINILDIPAAILSDDGSLKINDVTLQVLRFNGEEIFAFRELSASLQKNNDGYEGRVSARQADEHSGAFSFRTVRVGDDIIWRGSARNYLLSSKSGVSANFDLNLNFNPIPPYDLSEKTDNIARPQDYLSEGTGFVRINHADWNSEGNFVYDPEARALRVEEMKFDGKGYKFRGMVEFGLHDKVLVQAHDLNFEYPSKAGVAKFENVEFEGQLDTERRVFQIGELFFGDENMAVSASGLVNFKNELTSQVSLKADGVDIADSFRLWPKDFGDRIYDWARQNIHQGQAHKLRIDISTGKELKYEASASIEDAIIVPIKNMPPMRFPMSKFIGNHDGAILTSPFGEAEDKLAYDLTIHNLLLEVDDLKQRPLVPEVQLDFEGSASKVVQALSNEPISLSSKIHLKPEQLSGQIRGNLSLRTPLLKKVKWSDMESVTIKADIEDLMIRDIAGDRDFSAPSAHIDVSKSQAEVEANGQFDGINANLDLRTVLKKGEQPKIHVTGETNLANLTKFGIKLPESIFGGSAIAYDMDLTSSQGLTVMKGSADIRDISLTVPVYGRVKERGSAGTIEFAVESTKGQISSDRFTFVSGNARAEGAFQVAGGSLQSLNLRNVVYGKEFNGNIDIKKGQPLVIRDGFANLKKISSVNSGNANSTQNIKIQNMRALLPLDIDLQKVNGAISVGRAMSGNLTASIKGSTLINIDIASVRGQTQAHVTSDSGAGVMRHTGLFTGLRHGKLDFKIRTTDQPGLYAGKLRLTRTELWNSSFATRLLQAASIFGVLDPNGLFFNEIGSDLLIYPNRVEIYSGYAYGPSLGITTGGEYHYGNKAVDFVGVLTPAYLLNGVVQKIPGLGELLGGNVGEGVFGVTYQVRGNVSQPEIMANPFSLLTPGKLRDFWGEVPQRRTIPVQYRIE